MISSIPELRRILSVVFAYPSSNTAEAPSASLEAVPVSVGRRLSSGTGWALAGAVVGRSIGLANAYVMARILGQTPFGEYSVIQSTVSVLGTLAGFGLGTTATKYVAECRVADPIRANRIIGMSVLVALVSCAAISLLLTLTAPFISTRALAAPQLATALRIGALLLFFTAYNGAQIGVLAGLEAFRVSAITSAAGSLLGLPITALSAHLWSVPGAIAGASISSFLTCLITSAALRASLRHAKLEACYSGLRKELPLLFRFSLPATIGGLLTGPATWAGTALLASQPNGFAEVAIFGAANSWRAAILFVPGALGTPLLAILSSARGAKDRAGFLRIAKTGILINCAAALAMALPLFIAAETLMAGYGQGFRGRAAVLRLVILGSLVTAASNHVSRVVASIGRMWLSVGFDVVWSAAFLAAVCLFVPARLAVGLAVALVSASVAQAFFQAAVVSSLTLRRSSTASWDRRQRGVN